ncbi:transposable element Tcb2 transposase [Trichonephila clavipes]|nr:transposable element Tcb2 transposase [Trichonephila clavipes]
MRTGIWQLLPKETDGAQHQTCLVSSLQLPVRQFQRQTVYRCLGNIGLYARRPVRCVPLNAILSPAINLSREHALWTPQQWSCVMFSPTSLGLVCSLILTDINMESASCHVERLANERPSRPEMKSLLIRDASTLAADSLGVNAA